MDVVYTSVLYNAPSSIFMAEVGACNDFIIIIASIMCATELSSVYF